MVAQFITATPTESNQNPNRERQTTPALDQKLNPALTRVTDSHET
jgi:hypothetical protein